MKKTHESNIFHFYRHALQNPAWDFATPRCGGDRF
jgi:hypothetical protein